MLQVYELDVYKLAEDLSDMIWHEFDKWSQKVQWTIGYQIIRSSDSIAANIRLPDPGNKGSCLWCPPMCQEALRVNSAQHLLCNNITSYLAKSFLAQSGALPFKSRTEGSRSFRKMTWHLFLEGGGPPPPGMRWRTATEARRPPRIMKMCHIIFRRDQEVWSSAVVACPSWSVSFKVFQTLPNFRGNATLVQQQHYSAT